MIESQNIRQILAIMVTDIVDYTETMNNDEQKAWEYLKKQRTLIAPMISKMNGHMFKEMGDGTFSKFKSAIDAVHCAVKILEEAINNELPIRISVHLGDVMDDGVDVIGTGVNIASRINSLAKTGGIVISEDVWRQVRNQADLDATSMGQKEIKGIHQTVEVFELTFSPDGSVTKKVKVTETVTITDEDGKKVQAETAKKEFIKKVAIFPFEYDGEDESLNFLKYGFPFGCCISLLQDPLIELEFPNKMEFNGEDFINKLQKSGYDRGKNVPMPLKKKIAKELHCDYFVSGKIEFISSNYQITCKVFSSKNGKLLNETTKSAPNYQSLIDIFSMQIRKDIRIPPSHIDEIENLPFVELTTEKVEVFKKYIEGLTEREFENNYETSFNWIKEAVSTDPTFSLANFSLAFIGFLSNNQDFMEEANKAINSAIAHIYKLPDRLSYLIKMFNYLLFKGEPEKAEKVIKMWRRQYPESISPLLALGNLYRNRMKHKEAIDLYNEILSKYPDYYNAYNNLHLCFYLLGDYKNALINAEQYMKNCPTEAVSYENIADIYSRMCEGEKAKDYFEQALMLESDNCDYMASIAMEEFYLGNFSVAEDQLNDALTFCKSNKDFSTTYKKLSRYYSFRGKMKLSIDFSEKENHYLSKFYNPVDAMLMSVFNLGDYVLIGQKDIALKKQTERAKGLVHPWNLLAGLGEIFLYDEYNQDKVLLESGIKKVKEFLSIKPLDHIKIFQSYGNAQLYLFHKKFKEAIKEFDIVLTNFPDMKNHLIKQIMICHNENNDFQSAIKIGNDILQKDPNSPSIILEIVKSYISDGDTERAKEHLTKLLSIWEDADEEYLRFQDAKKLWKKLNTVKEPA